MRWTRIRKLRGVIAILGTVLIVWALIACDVSDRTTLRIAHTHPASPDSEIHSSAQMFKEHVEANTETLGVRIYDSNKLGDEREVYEAMQLGGEASAAITGTAILDNFVQRIGVLDLPFLWEDYDHVHRVLDGEVGDILASELEEAGFKVLAWMDSWGYRNVITNREVRHPEDLAGLKIRTIQSPTYVAALEAMGANPTPMAFGEVYTSMQTGVIDGFEHGAPAVLAGRYYEVAQHMALTQHLFGPLVFCMSVEVWNRLSEEEQRIVQEAALHARDEQRAQAPIREQAALDTLREKGILIHEMDTTGFHARAVELQDQLAQERGATDLLQRIREAR